MTKISIQNIQPGMVAKKDIKDKNGRLLLSQNTVIEQGHIRIFKIWGIYEVDIEKAEEETEESLENSQVNAKLIKKASRIISPKYAKANINNPCTREVFKQNALIVAHRMDNEESLEDANGLKLPDQEHQQEQVDNSRDIQYYSLRSILDKEIELSTLPDIFYRITEIINNPRSSARDISQVVEKDTALTARMLKLVNSPFYGFPQKIETISKAVTIVGTKQLSMLALGISATKLFENVPSTYIDMHEFWKHCLGVGLCAKLISEHMDYSESEKLFVAGILHDIGRMVMLKKIPKQTATALKYAWDNDSFLYRAEKKCTGFTHTQIGSGLCNSWKLPPMLVDLINYHHLPTQGKYPLECSILHLAEFIVNALDIGTSGEKIALYLNDNAWDMLDISSNAMIPIIEQLRNEVDVILDLMK